MKLHVKKTSTSAVIPKFAGASDAGMDICANETVTIEPGRIRAVATGIAMAVPEGYAGLLREKSSLGLKGYALRGGVIDSGYRGEIKVITQNNTVETITIEAGQKIANMIIQKVEHPEIVLTDELSETERGEGGFGSTGKF